jgi:DNA polymerase III subunit gamma/tau
MMCNIARGSRESTIYRIGLRLIPVAVDSPEFCLAETIGRCCQPKSATERTKSQTGSRMSSRNSRCVAKIRSSLIGEYGNEPEPPITAEAELAFSTGASAFAVENDRHYTVLARRFRPQTFDEVVGQEQIGQALRNAIRSGRVAHAYLFTGARGVGKTSTARIFAKALNCPNVRDAVPCNECDACQAISAGSDVDVLEIDGASNRGIDDIRTLRSNVNVRSMRSPNKVYIIDEVHMLTKEAFNALLKTLEEPPPNGKFVFCTTEANKVPDTILSRCQRFDFGTIATDSIAGRLKEIAQSEGIDVSDGAIDLVARRASGSMRDSQSMFDQLLAFGGQRITEDDVHRLLGTAPDDRLFQLVESVMAGDRRAALEQLDTALSEGAQLGSLADQLLSFLRDLLLTSAGASEVALLAVGPGARPRIAELSNRWGLRNVGAAMQMLVDCRARMQKATYARPLLELALVRITLIDELNLIADLVERRPGEAVQVTVPTPAQRRIVPSVASEQSGSGDPPSKKNDSSKPESLSVENAAAVAPSDDRGEAVARSPESPSRSLDDFEAGWSEVVAQLPETLANHVKKSRKAAISGPNHLEILFGSSYFLSKAYCERPESLTRLQAALAKIFGQSPSISVSIERAAEAEATKRDTKTVYDRRPTSAAQQDEFIQHAVSVFGGSVVELRETARQLTVPLEDRTDLKD